MWALTRRESGQTGSRELDVVTLAGFALTDHDGGDGLFRDWMCYVDGCVAGCFAVATRKLLGGAGALGGLSYSGGL